MRSVSRILAYLKFESVHQKQPAFFLEILFQIRPKLSKFRIFQIFFDEFSEIGRESSSFQQGSGREIDKSTLPASRITEQDQVFVSIQHFER